MMLLLSYYGDVTFNEQKNYWQQISVVHISMAQVPRLGVNEHVQM